MQSQEERRQAYKALEAVIDLRDELVEDQLTKLTDFDGGEMELASYQYRMGAVEPFPVVVKKGSDKTKLTSQSYKHLLEIKHPLLLPVQNFYEKGSNNNGWFIFPPVQGSLKGWLKIDRGNHMFTGSDAKREMSPLFCRLICEIFSLLDIMSGKFLYPSQIKMEDFFVNILHSDQPRILLMLTQVRVLHEQSPILEDEWKRSWIDVNSFIDRCCQISGIELSDFSKSFCKFVPRCTTLKQIQSYPISWTCTEKACYLYHMISGTPYARYVMKSKINEDSGLKWPKGDDGRVLPVIQKILNLDCNTMEDDKGKRISKYNTEKPFDYLQIFRNHHKHFQDLPSNIQAMLGGTREGLIRCMETWEPRIWIMLYESIGPAAYQCAG